MTSVMVLRPEPGASETVRRARERGLEAISIPLFEVEPVPWQVPDAQLFDALLLTSANAVRLAGEALQGLRGLPVCAVGEATAEAARSAGFRVAMTGNSGVARLLGSIPPGMRLLHLCGADRKDVACATQIITEMVVYRSRPIEAPQLSGASANVTLIHSPRAGQRFAALVSDRASISIAAISPDAAEAAGSGWKSVAVAERPTDDALLALAARLCNNR
jgi:uroporphyrinogen-III synthase